MKTNLPRIGTAGWSVPPLVKERFPDEGSHLVRYAQKLSGVEINSSFYRPHQSKTYRRWAEETPANFSFSVKMAKTFTHEQRLSVSAKDLAVWLEPVEELGEKFGALLVQLPPSLEFDLKIAKTFFKNLRRHHEHLIALEPRHVSWITKEARKLYSDFEITKVEADPERCTSPTDKKQKIRYLRLHGSPQIYKSSYEPETLKTWADEFAQKKLAEQSWIIFDNTTFGHATENALDLTALLLQAHADSDGVRSATRKTSRRPSLSKDLSR